MISDSTYLKLTIYLVFMITVSTKHFYVRSLDNNLIWTLEAVSKIGSVNSMNL